MTLEPVIGLEIHVQLKTKSKMFCSCENIFGDVKPNSAICPICMGYPGTLPVPNKKAIEWVQIAGTALGCEIATESKFDRKSYFYPDLPKGYQISQFDKPFCKKGIVPIIVNGEERKIGINRIHLEEDAAKNTHPQGSSHTLIDYNRAGTPLIEIVTEPDIASPEEAKIFLKELQRVIRSLGISDADMEKGQLRCDANISLREKGSKKLNPKTEIKNINSFRFVEKALGHEIKRQTEMHKQGNMPNHATRGWDSNTGTTTEQRVKEEQADYRYFPEPDIPPFEFDQKELNAIKTQIPEMPWHKRSRLMKQYDLNAETADLFTNNESLANFYEDTVTEIEQIDKEQVDVSENTVRDIAILASKVILHEIKAIIDRDNVSYPKDAHKKFKITPANFAELIVLIQQGKLNSNAVQDVLNEMQKTGGDPDHIIENLGLQQVNSEDDLEIFVETAIKENPEVIEKIKAGSEAPLQFLMGQVMAKSKGKANPKVVIEILKKKIGI